MKKALKIVFAPAMAFTLFVTGSFFTKANLRMTAYALCQYHRTDNVKWVDGKPYCKCCGEINTDAYCKHQCPRYGSYKDNEWHLDRIIPTSNRYVSYFVYHRDEYTMCSNCGACLGKSGHYQQKIEFYFNEPKITRY